MYTAREFAKKRINSGFFARFVLFLSGIGDDVAEKLTECFSAETDEELAEKINGAFYTAFSADEISAILESVREEYG